MVPDIRTALASGIIVGDGANGSFLTAKGLPVGVPGELWNAERPDAVRDVHRSYLAAGAQVLTSNTLTLTRLHHPEMEPHLLLELNRRGVTLAREAAGGVAWVAGDMSPIGKLLEPYGDMTVEQAEETFAEQARTLAEAGADFLLLETMTDVAEAAAALRATLSATTLPVAVTFAFDTHGRTLMGNTAAGAAREMEALGAFATGANCGDGPDAILQAIRLMAPATRLPLIAQANAGIPHLEGGQTQWDVTLADFRRLAEQLIALGVRHIGGCCGSTPEHIRAVREAVTEWKETGRG
jgi:5-methyltetrahydrofolate--homocysteine methyltransferase